MAASPLLRVLELDEHGAPAPGLYVVELGATLLLRVAPNARMWPPAGDLSSLALWTNCPRAAAGGGERFQRYAYRRLDGGDADDARGGGGGGAWTAALPLPCAGAFEFFAEYRRASPSARPAVALHRAPGPERAPVPLAARRRRRRRRSRARRPAVL